MSSFQDTELLSVEDYFQANYNEDHELSKGRLKQISPVGRRHGKIAAKIVNLLFNHIEQNKLGEIGVEGGFLLEKDPDTVRAPDVHFVFRENIPEEMDEHKFWPICPDLAVEIISPNDKYEDIISKIKEYQKSGTPLIWLVDPIMEMVTIYRLDKKPIILEKDDIIDENIGIPGIEIRVDQIFS